MMKFILIFWLLSSICYSRPMPCAKFLKYLNSDYAKPYNGICMIHRDFPKYSKSLVDALAIMYPVGRCNEKSCIGIISFSLDSDAKIGLVVPDKIFKSEDFDLERLESTFAQLRKYNINFSIKD